MQTENKQNVNKLENVYMLQQMRYKIAVTNKVLDRNSNFIIDLNYKFACNVCVCGGAMHLLIEVSITYLHTYLSTHTLGICPFIRIANK